MQNLRKIFLVLIPFFGTFASAQENIMPDTTGLSILYDRPHDIRNLYIGLQPLYSELYAAGVNAGFGADIQYYAHKAVDFNLSFRRSYSAGFFDLVREEARKNSNTFNKIRSYYFAEAGVTIHLADYNKTSMAEIFLHGEGFGPQTWAVHAPKSIFVPAELRTIIGARIGGMVWQSGFNVSSALKKQGLNNLLIGLPDEFVDYQGRNLPFTAFSTMYGQAIYAGISITEIKNIAVGFDQIDASADDSMVRLYGDVIMATFLATDDVQYSGVSHTLDTQLKMDRIGFRFGMDARFNRNRSWALGIEFGNRPGPHLRTLYANMKVSFPVFAFYHVQKNKNLPQ
jgi:hypothetical protein